MISTTLITGDHWDFDESFFLKKSIDLKVPNLKAPLSKIIWLYG